SWGVVLLKTQGLTVLIDGPVHVSLFVQGAAEVAVRRGTPRAESQCSSIEANCLIQPRLSLLIEEQGKALVDPEVTWIATLAVAQQAYGPLGCPRHVEA